MDTKASNAIQHIMDDTWAEWIDRIVSRRFKRTGKKTSAIEVDQPTYAAILRDYIPFEKYSQHKIGIWTNEIYIQTRMGPVCIMPIGNAVWCNGEWVEFIIEC